MEQDPWLYLVHPTQCDVCARFDADNSVLVPDRSATDPPFLVRMYCLRCLDGFLAIFPLRPRDLRLREVKGKWPRRPAY